jgi:NAD(P)-dependent dehydrogenase (short-subunit alcohol dehydrogenase family)
MELPRTPPLRLDGRRALVTGAGRGIGLACAAALAQAAARVVLAARTTSEVEELAVAIRRDGDWADPVTLDIADLKPAMAIDLGPHEIRVNTIYPTFIETPLARRFLANDEVRAWALSRIKLGRIGKVEDFCQASRTITHATSVLTVILAKAGTQGCRWHSSTKVLTARRQTVQGFTLNGRA